jgi:hypothetical protein
MSCQSTISQSTRSRSRTFFNPEAGRRTISVSLAYDPAVRHTGADYAGLGMSFRLVRGCESRLIFEHFRRRDAAEGKFSEIAARYNCALKPGPQLREKSDAAERFGIVQARH